jgi:hypothetical protein
MITQTQGMGKPIVYDFPNYDYLMNHARTTIRSYKLA